MQKILFVTDAHCLHTKALDFAAYICKLSGSRLTAVFLEDAEFTVRERAMTGVTYSPGGAVAELKKKRYDQHIHNFQQACANHEVRGMVHRDRGVPAAEVVRESLYADLILMDAETSFNMGAEAAPTKFVKEILTYAQCPVIVMPENFEGVTQLVFTYDGHPSSVLAARQFTYLFPELRRLPVSMVTVDPYNDLDQEDHRRLSDWLRIHYDQVNSIVCDSNVRAGLIDELLYKPGAFLVMGAFGRTALSNLLKPSPASIVLKQTTQPVFITHSH